MSFAVSCVEPNRSIVLLNLSFLNGCLSFRFETRELQMIEQFIEELSLYLPLDIIQECRERLKKK